MTLRRRQLLPLILVLFATACAKEPSPERAGGQLRLPRLAAPDHYALVITPDLAAATFTGDVRVDVQVLVRTPRIVLHAAEIAIDRATIESGGRAQIATVAFDADAETATLTVPDALAPGPARITLAYRGILNNQLRGLYLSEANGRRYAVTQLEATAARRMFPSFDEPALKATFDITAVIDHGDQVISNGSVVSDQPGPSAGKRTVTFSRTPKMSTYLVALVVGTFDCVSGGADGIPIRVCATPDKKPLTGMALRTAEELLRYFNQYFAIKYPFGKLDIVAVPDFAAGAMENMAAIFFREQLLLADEARASVGVRKAIGTVLAHEIAHHWFGNLVTMDWWNDLWLNEGFASWMETKPFKTLRPEWRVELDQVRTSLRAMDVDRLASTRPVRNPVERPHEIDEVFDAIAYSKGASALRMSEGWVGEDAFRQAINAYLAKYQYASARSEDFWNTIAASTGQPVDRVLSSFVDQPGVPVVTMASACASGQMAASVSQARYRELGQSTAAAPTSWRLPLCLRGPDGGGSCRVIEAPADRVLQPSCQPWIVANRQASGYYRTAYDPAALSAITKHVASLSSAERIMLASDVWAQVRAGNADAAAFLDLTAALASERTSAMVDVLGQPLSFIGRFLTSDVSRPRFEAWVRRVFRPALAQLGWTRKPGEPEDVAAVRASLVGLLGVSGRDPDVIKRVRSMTLEIVDGRRRVDPTLGAVVVPVAAWQGDAALYDRLLRAYREAKSPDDRQRYLLALSAFVEPALVRRTVDLVLSPDVRSQDAGWMLGRTMAGGLSETWPLISARWDDVVRKVGPGFGIMRVVQAVGESCDPAKAAEIRSFFEAHPVEGVERTLQQALERIASCAALARQQVEPLATWLAAN